MGEIDNSIRQQLPQSIQPNATQGKDGEKVSQQGTAASSMVTRTKTEAAPQQQVFVDIITTTSHESGTASMAPPPGEPALPPPVPSAEGAQKVPEDIGGNKWFSGNCFVNLKLAMIEVQSVLRETAQTLGTMSAELTLLLTELKQEEADLTKASHKEQAKMAMYEIIGAAVSIAVSVVNLAATAALMGATAKFTKTGPGKPVNNADGTTTTPTVKLTAGGRFKAGVSAGQTYSMGPGTAINQIGSQVGSIIGNSGKMIGYGALAGIESAKVMVQATADLIRKASQSLGEEANDALKHSDEIRQQAKALSQELARIFGSITPH